MAIRIISFIGGALFGAGGALIHSLWIDKVEIHWGIVGLCAFVMGSFAMLFGGKFWKTAVGLWP
jgi:hypothetical protein